MKKQVLFTILMVLPLVANADAIEVDGIYYNLITESNVAEVIRNPDYYTNSIVIPETINYNNVNYSVKSIGNLAFCDCQGLTSVTIPNSVTSIGYGAFYYCLDLTSVTIGNNVTSIGNEAFQGCSGLTSITIPNSVTSIGDWAFKHCSGLTSVTIGNSVTSIGEEAFYKCSNLTSVTIGNSVRSIGYNAFWGCNHLKSVVSLIENPFRIISSFDSDVFNNATLYVPKGTIDKYKATEGWKDFMFIRDADRYKLTFVADGDEYKSYEIEEGVNITPEPEPTKEGYTFSGWSEIPETMPAHDVTVTGSFSINSYNLTYKVDGAEYKTASIEYGSAITAETAPTKEGYTFSGWSEIPKTMPAHDVTVTGSFSINSYTLTYMVDGAEYKTASIEYGSAITAETAPTKEGYTFSGWSEIPTTMPAHDVTVKGSFSINSYNLTYKVDGQVYKTSAISYGTAIIAEANPTKEGYTFSGWSEIPTTMPAHNITVTGSFTINTYKVTYVVDGIEYKTEEVEYGSVLKPSTPTKEGYSFAWIDLPITMPAHDIVVNGSFTVNQYKVIFTVDGTEYQTIEVEYGADVNSIEEPTKLGYTFSGWIDIPETMPAHDVVINGNFSVNYYTISYVVNDNIYMTDSMAYGTEAIPIDGPEREGYTFIGWTGFPTTMPAHDVIAIGFYTVNSYILTYIVDGAEYKTASIEYGSAITAESIPAKEGYTFIGWSDIPATMPAHDVTVTGSFIVNKYKLIYMVGGKEYQTIEVEYGAEIYPIGGPEKEGYTFVGWENLPEETMPAHDVTVTGTFSINSYKVTFMYGDNVLTTIEVKYGEKIELPTSLNSERYTLIEWLDVPETMPAFDITIYADYVDGINDIAADSRNTQYIQMNGMYIPELKPGLNIIRMKDGTTKKVMVK